jgi:hypothetical protein
VQRPHIQGLPLSAARLSSRDKTQHLTPRAAQSGYEQTQAKLLARTVAALFCVKEVNGNMGDTKFWRRQGDLNPRLRGYLVLQGNRRDLLDYWALSSSRVKPYQAL